MKATQIIEYLDHTEFTFSYLWKLYRSHTQLLGAYNVNNILAAIGVAIEMGLDINTILPSIESFQWVDCRLQKQEINWATYFVDFAHTPDALEKTLSFLEWQKWDHRLITVFWVPWNRDTEKRPIMGEIAWRYSEVNQFKKDS